MSLGKTKKVLTTIWLSFLLTACSPRDFLTRRLATDLILASDGFKSQQHFTLQTGVLSNKDYTSPEYLILQRHGWISANNTACPPTLTPPCWDVLLTPSGVEAIRSLIPASEADKPSFSIPVATRQFIEVTGISKQGSAADVDFTWKWAPVNEIGAALYPGDQRYISTVGFRDYDDGWRIVSATFHPGQSLEDALKNAEPAP